MADPLSFAQQFWLSVVDKVLLGGIVALGGFFGTRAIEAYKSKQLLRSELTKQRVAKIEEVWKQLFALQLETEGVQKVLARRDLRFGQNQDSSSRTAVAREWWRAGTVEQGAAIASVTRSFDQMGRVIQREAFWLGRGLSATAQKQLTSMRAGFDHMLAGDTLTVDDAGAVSSSMTITQHLVGVVDVDYLLKSDL